jgi:hypothetical protein
MPTKTVPSAYPRTVDELIPHARDLADRLGKIPSLNLLTKTFKIGDPKAKLLLAALAPESAAPTAPEPIEPEPDTEPPVTPPPLPPIDPADEMAWVNTARPSADPADPADPAEQVGQVEQVEPWDGMAAFRNGAGDLMVTYPNAAGDYVSERISTAPESIRLRAHANGLLGTTEPAPSESPAPVAHPEETPADPPATRRRPVTWPVLILCLPAFVAIWGGWVEMGRMTGFGMVTLFPGVSDFQINTAITLPVGVETYAAYALYVWLSGMVTGPALRFAKWSAIVSLALGALGQVAYHLMAAAGWASAPWPITAAVSCIPVAVLGMGAGLAHLMHRSH